MSETPYQPEEFEQLFGRPADNLWPGVHPASRARVSPLADIDKPVHPHPTLLDPIELFLSKFSLPPLNFFPKGAANIEREALSQTVAIGATADLIDFTLPDHTLGVIKSIGHTSDLFAATVIWDLLLSGVPVTGWTRFSLQRGSLLQPHPTTIPVTHMQRVLFRVVNNSEAIITVSALLSGWYWAHSGLMKRVHGG